MWPFSSEPTLARLQHHKAVSIAGSKYTIRKVNPLIDFTPETMPQIFASFVSRRKAPDDPSVSQQQRAMKDMKAVVQAGLVTPDISQGSKSGIAVDDIFRDTDTAIALYWEIVIHSMNRFSGLKGVFFYLRTKYELSTSLRSGTAGSQVTSPSPQESSA